jgi:hypothetical protein
MTFCPESDSNVSGVTNFAAERVNITWTDTPAFCSPRMISMALYAAMHPVTPSAIFTMKALIGWILGFDRRRYLETKEIQLQFSHCDISRLRRSSFDLGLGIIL